MTRDPRGARGGEPAAPPPPSPVSAQTAEHYLWGAACDGWRLLDHDGLSVIEERMPPGSRERLHVHERARQFFYVLEGCLTVECDGRAASLRAGEGVHLPPGTPHRVVNASRDDATFLVVSAPATAGDRTDLESPPQ